MAVNQLSRKILFIGPHSYAFDSVASTMHKEGFEIIDRSSDIEALRILDDQTFDLVIVNLPVFDSRGLKLIEHICDNTDDIEIIVLSDNGTCNNTKEILINERVFDCFGKPFDDITKLLKSIHNALTKRELIRKQKRLLGEISKAKTYFEHGNSFGHLQDRIQKSKKLLQSIFDGIKDVLIILDRKMKIRAINKSGWEYFNLQSPKEAIGKSCHSLVRLKKKPCDTCQIPSIVLRGEACVFERKGLQDTSKWEQVAVYPIDSDGKTFGAIIRITDITTSKKLEEELIQTEKLASLGFLISAISHEINGPNNLISFNIPILREYLRELTRLVDDDLKKRDTFQVFGLSYNELRKDIFKLLDNIEHGSQRITKIVNDLREFIIRKDKAEIGKVDLNEVLNRVIRIAGTKIKKMVKRLELNICEGISSISSNPEAIEQILINFLINAAQAADKEDSWIKIEVRKKASMPGFIFVEVSDNGCGMDQETIKRIFDPFFSTKRKTNGTGLGLTICHILAKNIGAYIDVESSPGEGSKLSLVLPDTGEKNSKLGTFTLLN